MKEFVTQYNLVFSSISKKSLHDVYQKIIQSNFLVSPNFDYTYHKKHSVFSYEILLSVKESLDSTFSDYLNSLLDEFPNVTVGADFASPYGKGVLNPDLTKNYVTPY
tara:strand:- start:377 stop:697 length:321 start_codon:yes stop_codon:yes gene_type:complete